MVTFADVERNKPQRTDNRISFAEDRGWGADRNNPNEMNLRAPTFANWSQSIDRGPRNTSGNALDHYYGWNSSMGRDLRYDPPLPHQFQYRDQGRTVVSDTEPAWTDFGVPYRAGPPTEVFPLTPEWQWPDIEPEYERELEGIESLQEQAAVDPSDWRTILRILEAGGDPGTETAGLWQTWQKIKDRLGEEAANDWLASQQQYANRGGLMSLKG
jgi:hypothetical protein